MSIVYDDLMKKIQQSVVSIIHNHTLQSMTRIRRATNEFSTPVSTWPQLEKLYLEDHEAHSGSNEKFLEFPVFQMYRSEADQRNTRRDPVVTYVLGNDYDRAIDNAFGLARQSLAEHQIKLLSMSFLEERHFQFTIGLFLRIEFEYLMSDDFFEALYARYHQMMPR